MTISSSLNAGVAGLNANAARLASIADNISNSGTFGYKRARTDFESLVVGGTHSSGSLFRRRGARDLQPPVSTNRDLWSRPTTRSTSPSAGAGCCR